LPITKEKKNTMYADYLQLMDGVPGLIITEYRGMQMKNITAVRALLRPVGASYNVVKTSIFKKILAHYGFPVPDDLLAGPVAVAVPKTDLAKTAKVLLDIKDQPLLVLKGAIMGETVFKAEQIEALSKMPTLDEARAALLATLATPATGLVTVLAQPAIDLALVLQAYSDKQRDGEGSAA